MSAAVIPQRGSIVGLLSWLAVLAMVQPVFAVLAPDLAGWRPDHAHVYLSRGSSGLQPAAALLHHAHPYDAVRAGTTATQTDAATGETVAFVTPEYGASVMIVAAPSGPALAAPAPVRAEALAAAEPFVATLLAPEPPPPRS